MKKIMIMSVIVVGLTLAAYAQSGRISSPSGIANTMARRVNNNETTIKINKQCFTCVCPKCGEEMKLTIEKQ